MSEMWDIGDKIGGMFEIRNILGGEGKSGMGTIYICYYRWHQKLYALKTYQKKYAIIELFTNTFYKEALSWMGLESHPNIVQAHWVHKFDGQIYIVMEYIPPDNCGRVTLTHHLVEGIGLPHLRTLIWAIQFCYGMEYANLRGIKVHRDIKPDNILITLNKTLKITDWGLAKAFNIDDSHSGVPVGTPPYMPPEQFVDADSCTVKSDIYSFGIVLYLMVSGNLPFECNHSSRQRYFEKMHDLHANSPIPKLNNKLFPIIEKCLAKNQNDRWCNFEELRHELELLWEKSTVIPLPKPLEGAPLGSKEINQKGIAMKHLGRPEEAVGYHDKAIGIEPTFANAWNDKGIALWDIGKHKEALECFNKAIELDHEFVHPRNNKAGLLSDLGYDKEALDCYEDALKIDPEFIYPWKGKGYIFFEMAEKNSDRLLYQKAMECYDRALSINKRDMWALRQKELILNKLNSGGSSSDSSLG